MPPAPHGWSQQVVALLGLLVIAGAVAGVLLNDEPPARTAQRPPKLSVQAVAAVDPAGDGEHDGEVPNATDGNAETYWTTSRYSYPGGGFGKPGVGIALETNRPPSTVVVQSDTPGFTADIRSGNTIYTPSQQVGTAATFTLRRAPTSRGSSSGSRTAGQTRPCT